MRRLPWVVAALLLAVPTTARADVTPEYFTLPVGMAGVRGGLDAAPDGIVYFGAKNATNDNDGIGRLDPSQATAGTANGITGYPVPDNTATCCTADMRDVAWSATDGGLYFSRSDSVIGFFKGGVAQTTILHTTPWGIAAAPNGGAWFTEWGADNTSTWYGNRIGSVSPGLGIVTETTNIAFQDNRTTVDDSHYDAKPQGIAVAADGTPWFTQTDNAHGYRIASWTGGKYTEFTPPCVKPSPCAGTLTSFSGPWDVTVALDGTLWYTNQNSTSIGHLVPGGLIKEYHLSDMASGLGSGTPLTIKTAVDGTIWAVVTGKGSFPNANAVVGIDPATLTSTVYKFGATLTPLEVAPDTKGNVWVSGSPSTAAGPSIARLSGVIGTAPPATGVTAPPPAATTPQPTGNPLTPAVTVRAEVSKPTVQGDSISANQICVGPPADRCSLVYLIQTHEYVTGFPHTGKAAAAKLTTIGKATFTLKGGEKKKVTVKLNSKGKKLLKKLKHFKATLTVTETHTGQKKPKQILKKNVTFKKKKG